MDKTKERITYTRCPGSVYNVIIIIFAQTHTGVSRRDKTGRDRHSAREIIDRPTTIRFPCDQEPNNCRGINPSCACFLHDNVYELRGTLVRKKKT